jgi:hypothetical protein
VAGMGRGVRSRLPAAPRAVRGVSG